MWKKIKISKWWIGFGVTILVTGVPLCIIAHNTTPKNNFIKAYEVTGDMSGNDRAEKYTWPVSQNKISINIKNIIDVKICYYQYQPWGNHWNYRTTNDFPSSDWFLDGTGYYYEMADKTIIYSWNK